MQAAIKRHDIMNFEISYVNTVADVGRGPGVRRVEGGSVKSTNQTNC